MTAHFLSSQPFRPKRTIIAMAGALGHTLVCVVLWREGLLRLTLQEFAWLFSAIWVGHLSFLWFIVSGKNKKFKDPSMTFPQTLWSQFCVMLTVYFAIRLKAALLFFALLAIVFGSFKLNSKQLAVLIILSLLLYFSGMAIQFALYPGDFQFMQEVTIALSFGFVAVELLFVTSDLSAMRIHLQKKKMELESSLIIVQDNLITDELTGIRNRRYISGILEQQLNTMIREEGYHFSIAIIDIDHFKSVNDQYGHAAGDSVLKAFATCVQLQLRKTDYLARFGGEEFILVVPFAQRKQVEKQIERLRLAVREINLDHISPGIKLTMSAGVTEYKKPEPIEETLKRADKALYLAKEQGRDRVIAT